jgi:hypothetical protein
MKYKRLLLFAIPFLFAFSCNEKEDQIIADYENRLTGEWIWANSTYHNTLSGVPYILTPDSVGFAMRQIFLNDGTFHVYKNGLIESSGIYWLETSKTVSDTLPQKIMIYTQKENYTDFVELKISGDTLILDNTATDGTVKLFFKVNQ